MSTQLLRGLGDNISDLYGCGDPVNLAAPAQVSLLYPHQACPYFWGVFVMHMNGRLLPQQASVKGYLKARCCV